MTHGKRARKAARRRATWAAEHPNQCACDIEAGEENRPPRSPDDELVGEDRYLWPPIADSRDPKNWHTCNIRRCQVCGKEYSDAPAWA